MRHKSRKVTDRVALIFGGIVGFPLHLEKGMEGGIR